MDRRTIAQELTSILGLETPPIGVAFAGEAPPGVSTFEGEVPSPCTFWRRGESGAFFAPAERHFNCPVGAMVMGFELPPDVQQDLASLVGGMMQCGYIAESEPANIPAIRKSAAGIVYGPLQGLPLDPDLIVMWLTPRQAMLWSEAAGTCAWGGAMDGPSHTLLGRPGCAALPVALQSDRPTLSLGCIGMRTFTDISEQHLLAVVSGATADTFVASLRAVAGANRTMHGLYEAAKARVADAGAARG